MDGKIAIVWTVTFKSNENVNSAKNECYLQRRKQLKDFPRMEASAYENILICLLLSKSHLKPLV